MKDLKEIINRCEGLIRIGDLSSAARLLKTVSLRKVAEKDRLPLARIARRTGEISLGLRLLAVNFERGRAAGGLEFAPSAAEYAVLLIQNGSVSEARGLLARVPGSDHPDVLLAKAWSCFETWEYREAVQPLCAYIKQQRDPYQAIAGRINLAEAYVATSAYEKALQHLGDAIEYAKTGGHVRLLANGLHLRAQVYFHLGKIGSSDADLNFALEIFGKKRASDAFLIRRQIAFNQAHRLGDVKPLLAMRAEAEASRVWESVRECDFQILLRKFSQPLFDRLYFGTSYPAYRERLVRFFPHARISSHYLWGQRRAPVLDLGRLPAGITRQNHALFDLLLQDFYSPLRVGGLFARLFPREFFDLKASPIRVHQCLKRLREWIRSEGLPLDLRCTSRFYSLHATRPFGVRIPRDLRLEPPSLDPLERLFAKMESSSTFTAAEAQSILDCSKATMNRYLSHALSEGSLKRVGKGKLTKYVRTSKGSDTAGNQRYSGLMKREDGSPARARRG